MKLSIIIVTWNTASTTLKCINSIKKYLADFDYEIIVVDNASTDNTLSLLELEKDIKIINNEQNFGYGQGNNLGAKIARGEYILFLNSDMELIDNKLIDMYKFIKLNPKIGLIGPKLLNIDLSTQGSVFPPQTCLNAFKEFWLGQKSYSKYVPDSEKPIEVFSLSGGAMLIKHSLFNKIGGWDKRYFMYFEDLELCRQVKKLGYKIYYYPSCRLIHRHGASGKSLADSANQWRRLIPGSKIYNGLFKHYLLHFITWSGQKWQKLFSKK